MIMKTFEFTLVLENIVELSDQMEDALFQAGCDDALLSFRNGIAYLEFDRESENLKLAIHLFDVTRRNRI